MVRQARSGQGAQKEPFKLQTDHIIFFLEISRWLSLPLVEKSRLFLVGAHKALPNAALDFFQAVCLWLSHTTGHA